MGYALHALTVSFLVRQLNRPQQPIFGFGILLSEKKEDEF